MRYGVFGPFELPRNGKLVAHEASARNAFWNKAEVGAPGLGDACGCYVFLVGTRAWYIGKTEKQSFRKECFADHKLKLYNIALQKVRSKPKLTPKGFAANPSSKGHKDISELEKLLIGVALQENPELCNVKDTRILRELQVPGVINTGQGEGKAHAVQALRKAIGV